MEFKVGDTVVYPHHGAAVIEGIEQRQFKGETVDYLVLRINQGDLSVRVPAANAEKVGVRDVVGEEGLRKAQEFVRDFSRIGIAPDFPERFTPAVSQLLFEQSVAWLEERFAEPFDGKTVVITHFAPARGSIAVQFAGSPLNACFVSDLEERILRWQPGLWLHGHVHDGFDYCVGNTRIVANPRGYAPEGVTENKAFMPGLLLEV